MTVCFSPAPAQTAHSRSPPLYTAQLAWSSHTLRVEGVPVWLVVRLPSPFRSHLITHRFVSFGACAQLVSGANSRAHGTSNQQALLDTHGPISHDVPSSTRTTTTCPTTPPLKHEHAQTQQAHCFYRKGRVHLSACSPRAAPSLGVPVCNSLPYCNDGGPAAAACGEQQGDVA